MSSGHSSPFPSANGIQWDQNEIYHMLSDPMRRAMISSMGRNGPNTATALAGGGLRRVNCALKHSAGLRASGLVILMPNPADGHRQLYGLSPNVPFTRTDTGIVLHFGFCTGQL